MPTYLADILASHRARAEADRRALADLVEQAASTPAAPGLRRRARGATGSRASPRSSAVRPSKGDLDPGLQPDLVAKEYVAGGASCLSVLTDVEFFGGSAADLAAAREASGLPVLRKDFTVQEADVADARLMGADAVLLIAAALDDDELAPLRRPGRASSAWPRWSRCTTRRSSARALAAGARPRRGEPTRPAHVRGGPRACLRAGGAHPGRCRGGGRVGHPRTRPTPGGWPRPATTPSWWARRWCAPGTGPAQLRSWSGARSGRR